MTDALDSLRISRAVAPDAGEILTVQRAAYVSEAQVYGDPFLPPLTQTLAELAADIARSVVLKAAVGTRIVGTVRARRQGDTWHIGRLAVAPDQQGRGLGTALLLAIEAAADPAVTTYALFTGGRSVANLRLYARHGYVDRPGLVADRTPGLTYLGKRVPATGA